MPYEPVTNAEPWAKAEDECLRKAYKRYHQRYDCFGKCAKMVTGRTVAQCRYRWHEYLSPDVDRGRPWCADEEATMVGCVQNNDRPLKEIFDEYFPRRPHSFLRAHWRRVQRDLERERERRSKRTSLRTPNTPYKRAATPKLPGRSRAKRAATPKPALRWPVKKVGSSKPPLRRGRSRGTARVESSDDESYMESLNDKSDSDDVPLITSHIPRSASSSTHLLVESSGTPSLQPSSQPAEPPYADLAKENKPLAAAFTLFCAPPAMVEPAVRNRAQDFLVEECMRSTDHRVRIAITLFQPTASAQTRALAQEVLLNSMQDRVK